MSRAMDDSLLERLGELPAPLLPLLHAFHERDGLVSEEALCRLAEGLKIPKAELYGTLTFYHHLSRVPGGQSAPRVCTGPICRHRGGLEILEVLRKDGAVAMACAGRCDEPVPVLFGNEVRVGRTAAELRARPSPLPVANPGGAEECVFSGIREPGRATVEGYEKTGGYEALRRCASDCSASDRGTSNRSASDRSASGLAPSELMDLVGESGLAGRGGAGFSTARKWRAVAEAKGGPKTIVANADEGEPGCFKDRVLMDHDPHALIEGMCLAAYATGASRGFIYLRYEYPETHGILEKALEEARAAGHLGQRIHGSNFSFEIHLRRGAGAYICGEETSLLNSLEGKHPFPRNRPPFPVTHGYEGTPTAVNNVETLCSVAPIVRKGVDWYQSLGLGENAGTKVISLSGDIQRPGNYEVPLGLPLQTLLQEWAGGAPVGRSIQAVTMAGLSGGFLAGEDLTVRLDEADIRSKGSFLGAGGIMVFDDSRDMVQVAHSAMEFFAQESCGKCFPCRIGTRRLTERLAQSHGPADLAGWKQEADDLSAVMRATSACGLGQAAPMIVQSLMKYFPEQLESALARGADA